MGHRPQHWRRKQFAALPYRRRRGEIQFLFVTSRDTRQWIIPKGKAEFSKGRALPPYQVAQMEARQEAGVTGTINKEPIGGFHYDKRIEGDRVIHAYVRVFLLRVKKELTGREWDESAERERVWLTRRQAKGRLLRNSHVPSRKNNVRKMESLFAKAEEEILRTEAARRQRMRRRLMQQRMPHAA
jgi:8-oxo-dGTP pyrophosphatase MutT (NUDIX family)